MCCAWGGSLHSLLLLPSAAVVGSPNPVAPMSAAVELAFSARVLQLSAVLDAMSFFSAVEALVASWRGGFSFALLLLIVP